MMMMLMMMMMTRARESREIGRSIFPFVLGEPGGALPRSAFSWLIHTTLHFWHERAT
jgi:hypothetical protein